MNRDEFEKIRTEQTATIRPMLHVADVDITEGTLIYGYSLERHTVHTFVKDGLLHRVIYSYRSPEPIDYIVGESLPAEDLVPTKRAYPERTRSQIVSLIRSLGVHFSVTNFHEDEYARFNNPTPTFHGPIVNADGILVDGNTNEVFAS